MADNPSSTLPSLTVLGGDKAGTRFVLEEPVDNILVGSDPSCRFCIDVAGVSPVHARIWVDDTGITVYDTNSPRGLYVNDERVTSQVHLRNGDVIWLGPPGDEQSVMIQCRVPAKEGRSEPARAEPTAAAAPVTSDSDAPFVVPEGGFAAEPEAVASPLAVAPSEPLPPPASLLPPPAPPARNEFEEDMGEATLAMGQAPAASTATPAPVSPVTPASRPPLSTTPRPHATPHVPPAHPGMTPAPARPASVTPVPRSAARPAGPRPASSVRGTVHAPRPQRKGKSPVVFAVVLGGLVLLAALAAGAFYLFRGPLLSRMVSTRPSPEARPTVSAATQPTPAVTAAPVTTPAPSTTEPAAPATPTEIVIPVKSSTPTPTGTPARTPTPTKTPTPARTPSPAKAGSPSAAAAADALRAQQAAQVAGLIAQAEEAYASQRFDAAVGLYDEALRVNAGDARAAAGRQAASAAAFCWKRSFVSGRTNVQAARGGRDSNLQGFESADVKVARAPDYSGLIEFSISPVRVKPGDGHSIRVNLTNDGKKGFRVAGASVTVVVNGERTAVPVTAPTGDVAPRQTGTLAQLGGSWPESTRSWSLEVSVSTTRGDTFSNQVNWR